MCHQLVKVTPSREKRNKQFCSDNCQKKYWSLYPRRFNLKREQNLTHLLRTVSGMVVDWHKKEIILDQQDFEHMQKNGVDPRMTVLQWHYGYKAILK